MARLGMGSGLCYIRAKVVLCTVASESLVLLNASSFFCLFLMSN